MKIQVAYTSYKNNKLLNLLFIPKREGERELVAKRSAESYVTHRKQLPLKKGWQVIKKVYVFPSWQERSE
jgi:hypothetical protein